MKINIIFAITIVNIPIIASLVNNENKQCVEGNAFGPWDKVKCSGWVQGKCPVEDMKISNSQVVELTKSGTQIAAITITDPDGVPPSGYGVASRTSSTISLTSSPTKADIIAQRMTLEAHRAKLEEQLAEIKSKF